jgi:hypothetical protein
MDSLGRERRDLFKTRMNTRLRLGTSPGQGELDPSAWFDKLTTGRSGRQGRFLG